MTQKTVEIAVREHSMHASAEVAELVDALA